MNKLIINVNFDKENSLILLETYIASTFENKYVLNKSKNNVTVKLPVFDDTYLYKRFIGEFLKRIRGVESNLIALWLKNKESYALPPNIKYLKNIKDTLNYLQKITKENLNIETNIDAAIENFAEFENYINKYKDISGFEISNFYKPLYDFQKVGVNFLMQKQGKALICDEMGLGKTIQALAFCAKVEDSLPVLVVCPGIVKYSWQREIEECLQLDSVILDTKNVTKNNYNKNAKFYIINYDVFSVKNIEEINIPKINTVIADEVHYIKNLSAKRTQTINQLIKQQKPKYIIGLTGTPIRNRPYEIYNTLIHINPTIYNEEDISNSRFAFAFCNVKRVPEKSTDYDFKYTVKSENKEVKYKILNGSKNEELLHSWLMLDVLRRRKEEVLTELPAKRFSSIVIDLKNYEKYEKAENELKEIVELLRSKENEESKEVSELKKQAKNKLIALTHIVSEEKYDGVLQTIVDTASNVEKLIVFGVYLENLKRLHTDLNKLGIKNIISTGEIDIKQRAEDIQNSFQNGDTQVLLATMRSTGIGVTLTASSTVLIYEYPFVVDEYEQAIDRAHRISQTKQVDVLNIVGRKTIDERVLNILKAKKNMINKIVDGLSNTESMQNNIMQELLYNLSAKPKPAEETADIDI